MKVPKEFVKTYIEEVRGEKQKKLLLDLLDSGDVLKGNYPLSTVKSLVDKGIIEEEKHSVYRIDKSELKSNEVVKLTDDQQNCFDEIIENKDHEGVYLLHGVTGSGKTEVYMHLISEIVKSGKSAIMLVPEITLTMQVVDNFYRRFGDDVSILHSGLSQGEKYDEYLKVLRGDSHIIVGTRSAVFAPLNNLGIIIIDEEHSESYKQDNTPRYNAIEVAKWRGKYNDIPVVLGSATPTYESYARALKGVYKLLTLPKRIGAAELPTVKLVDMAGEVKGKNRILSKYLEEKISGRLEQGEQSILLLNRRGFGTMVSCNICGNTFKCPNCDITLTYHKSSNALRCHYCGYFMKKPEVCPECKEGKVQDYGVGTEKLEEEIKKLYPEARVVRMDADTTSKKGSHERIINDFKSEKYDIMLGTQMISKGLDFPKVTLVGVVNADASLNIPDFRSGERIFSLLNQVAGRAGRSGLKSEVVIQTYNPDNFTLKMVEVGTFLKNYQYEMSIRKKLKYPPYYYLVLIRVCSREYEDASVEVTKVANYLKSNIDKESIVLGPTTAGVFRVNNVYRFQIVVKYKFDEYLKQTLKEIDEMYINHKTVYIEVDMDPYYM
ncbi:MAG TPA: primosomal protein N' [Firmicutes bacterium]|nr:primosomal protein N' [Bacillota bacterium]